jgi:hypothetical protein
MAMQPNCSGSSRDLRAKRIVRGRPVAERGGREYLKFSKALARTGKCGAPSRGRKGQTLTGFLRKYFLQEAASSKEHFGHDLLTNWEPATLSNPTKVGEHRAFPSLTTALFAAKVIFHLPMEKHIAPYIAAHISIVILRD